MKDPDKVGLWSRSNIGKEFGLPKSVVDQIKSSYQSTTQRKDAYLDAYTHHHPCPSWKKVVEVLRWCRLDQQVKEVENTYLKGTLETKYLYKS